MLQAIFYATIGSTVGLVVVYGFIVPYIAAHPIHLPISNAVIVAPVPQTAARVALLIFTTMLAGYLPSKMIVSKNTLDSILGRE
jgi:hypothetical protein